MRIAKQTMLKMTSTAAFACVIGSSFAGDANSPYPAMAPIAQYRMASADEEIALARSAAPPSISGDAEILVLGARGYETPVKGKNGFVCLVQRSWTAGFNDPEFWNPEYPISHLPQCRRGAQRAAAYSRAHTMGARRRFENRDARADQGADHCYDLRDAGNRRDVVHDVQGTISVRPGRPLASSSHVLRSEGGRSDLGCEPAELSVLAGDSDPEPVTTFFVPVMKWSDGTPQTMDMK